MVDDKFRRQVCEEKGNTFTEKGQKLGNTFAEKGQYQGKSLRSIRHTLATGRQQKQLLHQSWV